jgi:hypothetical protein
MRGEAFGCRNRDALALGAREQSQAPLAPNQLDTQEAMVLNVLSDDFRISYLELSLELVHAGEGAGQESPWYANDPATAKGHHEFHTYLTYHV